MFVVKVDKNNTELIVHETVTSGSVGAYAVKFKFSEEWENLVKTATFRAGETNVSVILDERNICSIPWEVMTQDGVDLYVGVCGVAGTETVETADDVVLPTVWTLLGTIRKGVSAGAEPAPPTPDLYEQIVIEIAKLDANKQDKLSGTPDQIVGFGADGNAVAVAKPEAESYDDTEIRREISDVKNLVDTVSATTTENTEAIGYINDSIGQINKSLDDVKTNVQQLDNTTAEHTAVITQLGKEMDDVQADVQANTDALNVLNGTGDGSVSKAVADGIAAVVAGAPESLDTLKEISDWIENHSETAAEMNSKINQNTADISKNTADIAANTAAIGENTAEIAANYEDILKNSQDIAKNTAIITLKQDKLSGTADQIVGFNENGEAIAVAKPESYDDTEIRQEIAALQDVVDANTDDITKKQNKLSAGPNIKIEGDVISATDTVYDDSQIRADITEIDAVNEAQDVDISELQSGKQDKLTGTVDQVVGFDADGNAVAVAKPESGANYTAGLNISISASNVISVVMSTIDIVFPKSDPFGVSNQKLSSTGYYSKIQGLIGNDAFLAMGTLEVTATADISQWEKCYFNINPYQPNAYNTGTCMITMLPRDSNKIANPTATSGIVEIFNDTAGYYDYFTFRMPFAVPANRKLRLFMSISYR